MTKFKVIVFVLFTAFISSCSSNDSNDDENSSAEAYFNFTYDGKVQTAKTWEAQKQGDFIEVLGTSQEGMAIGFKFNIYGNLYQATTNPTSVTSQIPWLVASENFTSNTFTFTLENLNTTDKTVQVKFSGKVYENGYDYESDFVNVSGSFKVPYKDITPEIEGLGTFAKIDGKDWHGLAFEGTIENQETKIIYAQNDGEYTIGIAFPDYEAKTGTYNFTSNNTYRISFQKYDVATHEDVTYDVSGTVTFTTLNDYLAAGTFSLTATHPVTKAKIVISNGTFKESAEF
ncbi:DUF6252 family protein [Flavobacterium sp. UBA7680]|uniref:DUF6252 family protein n=1 Tax=Flavobacterium sp. UBA7680 TaxID=1946559 RepID=UPI0025C60F40|nr:DUF6252 family protein [Flavobacterium sp. UBA7680]